MAEVTMFRSLLEERNIYMEEFINDSGSTVFRAEQNLESGSRVGLVVLFSEGLYDVIVADYIKCDNPLKHERILELINDLNCNYRFTKFVFENGNVSIRNGYYSDNGFEPQDALDYLVHMLEAAEEAYPKFMKVIWA